MLCWRTKEVLQYGGSILRSVILCGTFRRISQLWDNAHSLNLENCLLYLSSTISQFFDFVRCIVFDFIFLLRDSGHTLLDENLTGEFKRKNSFTLSKSFMKTEQFFFTVKSSLYSQLNRIT